MDRNCHTESQRSTPPNDRSTDINGAELRIHKRRFNCPFPDLRCQRQCIGSVRSDAYRNSALVIRRALPLPSSTRLGFQFPTADRAGR